MTKSSPTSPLQLVVGVALLQLLLCFAQVNAAGGLGFDMSGTTTTADLECMLAAGYKNFIVRAWHSTGTFDTNAPAAIANAHAAGIPFVDVYMFPCSQCSATASTQFNSMVSSLRHHLA